MEGESAEASSRSWVVDMERFLEQTDPSTEMVRWTKASIYRVPERIKNLTNRDAYRPLLVSLGPFHHGDPALLPMEEHKRRALLHLVKRARRPLGEFVAAVEEVVDQLLDTYDNLDERWRGVDRHRFVEVMLTDGCFLLEMMRTREHVLKGEELDDYAPNDPVFSIHGFYFLRPEIQSDMILMENQLPLLVLQRISVVQRGISSPSANDINEMVLHFLDCLLLDEDNDELGLHPLDLFHKSFRDLQPVLSRLDKVAEVTVPSAVELSEAGVHFKKSSAKSVCDIEFENGVLRMPLIRVYDETEKIYLNIMAFERLYMYAGNDVTDYLIFMDNMINSERDVALLRSKGLIKSGLGSDNDVVQLFNSLSKGAVMSPFCKLLDVQKKMNDHCRKPFNKWQATFKHTYLSNPWVFISLVAAVVLLVATLMQTIYTVVPFYTKK
ncbi:UPF0481 protein At3g47200-like [Panicum virgatum]|uniref:Uncharacterized protein n=1 Tax=Panicum virgatum TaxID=38727 RepID=A0A8T0P7B0_PANVG|nr:UPF0481 protein At3g47200-like [Panicum virgatum]KAG2558061.1 hypothetical protein PVAP13_8NG135402 [Panicum virgatum]